MSELLSLGDTLVKRALENGADDVEIFMADEKKNTVNIEKNEIQIGKSQEKEEVGIRVLIGDKMGFASVNSFEKDKIMSKVKEAISVTSASISDENYTIPNPKKSIKVGSIYDPSIVDFDIEDSVKYAERFLRSAKEYDERFQFNTGSFSAIVTHRAIVNSRGIRSDEKSSIFHYDALGMAVDGEDVSSFDSKQKAVHFVDEIDVECLGREISKNTVETLGAKKAENFVGPAVFSPEAMMMISYMGLIQPLKASRVQKGMSKFADKLGKKITDSRLTITDESNLEEGIGCRAFDREGIPAPNLDIIKDGTLKNYYHNSYTGNKEGIESTGHAAGSASQMPKINPSNFVIKAGDKTKEELIGEMEKGIYINRFSGNIDPVSGDISGVAKGGSMIKDGEKKYPIKETMISGNVFELIKNISGISKEVESIPLMWGGNIHFFLPQVRFEELSITSD